MPIRAVFLDRDGTVAQPSAERTSARDAAIARLLGKESFTLTKELEEHAFRDCIPWTLIFPIVDVESESRFWQQWFASVLNRAGYEGNALAAATELRDDFPIWKLLEPYPDAPPVLRAIRRVRLRIGIISESLPSLALSFREMGLAEYVDAYTSAYVERYDLAKRDPRIYLSALHSLDVSAAESIYVDDLSENVDVAGRIGMRAFRIDRNSGVDDPAGGVISTLWPLLEVLSIAASGDASGPEHCESSEPGGLP